MSDEGKGCFGCIVVIVAIPLLLIVFTFAKTVFFTIKETRDARLAQKAQQAEIRKAEEAEKARIAEIERHRREAEEAEKARVAEIERQRREAVEAARRRQEEKDDKIRTFALKEAPRVWNVYQSLQSEIVVQNERIEELKRTLEEFGRSPSQDTDFIRINKLRDDMIRSKDALRSKLEDAYIAARKYEASPSRKDYLELHRKALEDGIQEADAASAKFKEMRLNK